jgi:hypothetical protein
MGYRDLALVLFLVLPMTRPIITGQDLLGVLSARKIV